MAAKPDDFFVRLCVRKFWKCELVFDGVENTLDIRVGVLFTANTSFDASIELVSSLSVVEGFAVDADNSCPSSYDLG